MTWKQFYADCPSMLKMYNLHIASERAEIQYDLAQSKNATSEQQQVLDVLSLQRMEELGRIQAGGFIAEHVEEILCN